eukprot:scaffold287126_cov18-Tisochrysis_lutea.AAC.1
MGCAKDLDQRTHFCCEDPRPARGKRMSGTARYGNAWLAVGLRGWHGGSVWLAWFAVGMCG